MLIEEFVQTKLFGALFCAFVFFAYGYFVYKMGWTKGYTKGWKDGIEVKDGYNVPTVVTEYVYNNKRIARFDPRFPEVFLVIDFEEKTIARVPYTVAMNKEVVSKMKK